MTELQIGLIGLGATAVIGVFGYNKWQEYRHRKVAESVLQPDHNDVLLGDAAPRVAVAKPVEVAERSEPEIRIAEPVPSAERAEPVWAESDYVNPPDIVVEEPAYPSDSSPFTADPVFQPVPLSRPEFHSEAYDEVNAGPVPVDLLDPRLEFIVAMELVESVPVMQILHSQRDVLLRLNKPVHWVGFNERNREWERLQPDSHLSIRRLRIGLQLVNRLGPVSPSDVAIFGNAIQALADELMAVADMPPSRVLDQAAELDQFCAAVDLEIGVNLVSRAGSFSGTKIRALAEAAGMVLGIDGLFTRYDDLGRAQFSLQNYETTAFSPEALRTMTTHGLTFLLDVPRVDHGERVFMQMTDLAKRFAETLQGVLVDDNRQPLSDAQLEHIRREFIGKPQSTMTDYGIPAGSARAQRLFS